MDHSRTHGTRTTRAIVGALVALVAIAGFGGTAAAGGWAVTTLDAVPAVAPGIPVDVGFTIRQHGVTPVDLKEDVAIQVTAADGAVETFPASLDGPTGHYVATVVLAQRGEYTWTVQQGWFAPQELGTLTVGSPSGAAGPSGEYRMPAPVRYGLPALAAGACALAVADLIAGRRRRTVAA